MTNPATIIVDSAGVIAAVAAPFGVYWLKQKSTHKALTYAYSSAKIARLEKPFAGSLKIVFTEQEVQDASLVSVTLRNAGRTSIQRKDFDGPLQFRLSSGVILAQQVSETKPGKLPVQTELIADARGVASALAVEPLLLNVGDEFTILALVSGRHGEIEATGRIVGVREIKRRSAERAPINPYVLLMSFVATVCWIVLFAFSNFDPRLPLWSSYFLGMILAVAFVSTIWSMTLAGLEWYYSR